MSKSILNLEQRRYQQEQRYARNAPGARAGQIAGIMYWAGIVIAIIAGLIVSA